MERRIEDEELLESAAMCATMLRTVAGRWRSRAGAGRLGSHSLPESLRLVALLERAANVLESQELLEGQALEATLGTRTQTALRDSEERFRLLVDSVKDYAIFMLDPEGVVGSWNAGAERITGYRAEEIVGQHFSVLYTSDDVAGQKPAIDLRVAITEGRLESEGWRLRSDGARFFGNVVLTPLRDPPGNVVGYSVVVRDISERRRTEEALRQSEERFRLMVESVRDYAIFMLDPTGHIASWNAGAERIKGYTADEIVGRHFSTFYAREDIVAGKPERELEVATREGRYQEESWRVRKDGTRFWASVVLTAMRDPNGRLVGFAKVTRDFTERRRNEEAIRELNDQLRREVQLRIADNQELEAFSYSVSHDLRAPLRALDGFSKVVADSAKERLTEKELDYLTRVREASRRMSGLIDDMLMLSRVTRAPLAPQELDLGKMGRELVEEIRQADPQRRVEVSYGSGLSTRADPRLVRLLLDNLLRNAWKFTRGREPARIELGGTESGGEQVYFVRDNGVGFESSKAEKLFLPYQRFHRPKDFEGTGIGLATASRVARRHGGRIWAESSPGAGATFFFTLAGRGI